MNTIPERRAALRLALIIAGVLFLALLAQEMFKKPSLPATPRSVRPDTTRRDSGYPAHR